MWRNPVSDVEKLKITEAFKMFQIAVAKTKDNAAICSMFAMGCSALGWVLDEPHYREAFQTTLRDLKAMNVIVAPLDL